MQELPNDLRKIAKTVEDAGLIGGVTIIVAANQLERLTNERDGEREARHRLEAAYRQRDAMFNKVVERAQRAGIDFSDLQS